MGIFPDISTATLVAVVLVYLFAGMIKGAFGFGLPLASIALLPLFIPIDMALGVNAGLLPASNIFQFAQGRMMRETVVRFWPLLSGVTVGVAIGAPLAKGVDKQVLTVCLGVLVMAFTVMTRFRPEFHIPTRHERSAGVVAGSVGVPPAMVKVAGRERRTSFSPRLPVRNRIWCVEPAAHSWNGA